MAVRIFVVGLLFAVIAACGDSNGESRTTHRTATAEDQPVRITFQRSGGFAGISRTFEISSDELAAEDAATLRGLVDDARFFELPEELAGDGGVADEFTYEIAIEAGDRSHTVRTGEAAAPDSLVPLLDWLNRAMRSGGG